MSDLDLLVRSPLVLRPDPSRTVVRPFAPGDPAAFAVEKHPRARRIIERVLGMHASELRRELLVVAESLDERHRDVAGLLLRRYDQVREYVTGLAAVSLDQARLIGAYFSDEYAFEAAALFNPSMVLHPDQSGVEIGEIRFIISLRGIGEGHVSSVTFRTGTWSRERGFAVARPSEHAMAPVIDPIEGSAADSDAIRLCCEGSEDISETVLFPMTPSQRQGIEDLRLVTFVDDDGTQTLLGTYTAFSGTATRSEILRSRDLSDITMRALSGVIAETKGTALFSRRINGRYAMLGRQDNESIWLLTSDSLYDWPTGVKIISPQAPWEFVQLGNSGSPIELDEGWLVLTHGVGAVRNYSIGACLLDKDDPTKVLARLAEPLVRPNPQERDGYVPNVVYSCGGIVHDRTLLLPFGVADNFTTFGSIPVDDLLRRMQ